MKNFKWLWCDTCNCACIECKECGNISCSGGGCEKCDEDFTEAIRLVNEGKIKYSPDFEIVGKFPQL
jgi:hypothetical protein